MRRLTLAAAALTAIIVVVALIVAAVLTSKSRAEACRERGGTVVKEIEYENKRVKENGRTVTKRVQVVEHECHVGGQEVDEW